MVTEAIQPIDYLTNQFPHLVKPYKNHVLEARRTVLHQLVQAVVRERLVEVESKEERLVIRLNREERIEIQLGDSYGLGQMDMEGELLHIGPSTETKQLEAPEHLLELLPFSTEEFVKEMNNSTENYALALTIAQERRRAVMDEAASFKAATAYQYAAEKKSRDPEFSALNFFEQWVIQGHTIHPGARTRMGMAVEDIVRFAPEWGAKLSLIPIAVHKSHLEMTTIVSRTVKQILHGEYPDLAREFALTCQPPEAYEIIPVHPWQFEHTIKKHYSEQLNNKTLIPLSSRHIETVALISFRTLAPRQELKHHIKTAVNVQMTSAVRTVSAASTKNGPLISKLLEKITASDALVSGSLSIMKDVAGIHYEPEAKEKNRNFLQKNLASIVRENPEAGLEADEMAVPAAALVAKSPVTGKLLAEEFIDSTSCGTVKWIEAYAEMLLPGILTLMTKYGLSMEAHLQNCVVVFRAGVPVRVVLRDNGGIRVMNERLTRFFANEQVDPSTNLVTEESKELVDIFSHAVFHNHLGEIIAALVRTSSIEEGLLWSQVKRVIEKVYQQLRADHVPESFLKDEERILQGPSRMKALVRMRLTDRYSDYDYVDAPNPFELKNEVKKQ